jgi:hypothetical protein
MPGVPPGLRTHETRVVRLCTHNGRPRGKSSGPIAPEGLAQVRVALSFVFVFE